MTLVLVAQCLSLQLPQTQKLILQSLANYVDADGIAFPGKDIIATEASVSERRLRPHIKALEEEGWIRILSVGNGRGQTTRYQLNVERIEDEYRQTIADRKALRAQKGDTPSSFVPWGKEDVAVIKGDAAVQKGDVAVIKGDSTEQLTVLPVSNRSNRKAERSEDKPIVVPKTEVTERFLASIRPDWIGKLRDFDDTVAFWVGRTYFVGQRDKQGFLLKKLSEAAKRERETPKKPSFSGSQPSSAPAPVAKQNSIYAERDRIKMEKFRKARARGIV